MFDEFQARYPRDSQVNANDSFVTVPNLSGLADFLRAFGGTSFRQGIYRVVAASDIEAWNERVCQAFPEFAGRITCFGYDWLGRAFALDQGRLEDGQPGVVMFEPGTGEALEIPCNLHTFHTDELLEFGEAALAISFHKEWLAAGGMAPSVSQCVGYKKPLFLGGVDEVENLEVSDLDVYWHLSGQMIRKTRGLPPGTTVRITQG